MELSQSAGALKNRMDIIPLLLNPAGHQLGMAYFGYCGIFNINYMIISGFWESPARMVKTLLAGPLNIGAQMPCAKILRLLDYGPRTGKFLLWAPLV